MILRALRIGAWRNLAGVTLTPGPRATVLHGQNGQGKTNVVEAAYVLTTFRSFRTQRLEEACPWGAREARVAAEVGVSGLERRIDLAVDSGRKLARLDGKAVRRDASGLAGVAAVLFVPADLLLPRAAPSERRRFVDRAIFAADRSYAAEAIAFDKVLRSRNALLRAGSAPDLMLDTFDERLAQTGARVVIRRRALVAALAPRLEALFGAIHGDLGARIRYRGHPSVDEAQAAPDIEQALHAGLAGRRELDQRRRFTGFGPHTDDLEMSLADHPAKDHGSQGQLRSLVLALKLAELEHLHERLGEPPLLLLDDVASELDGVRRAKLFETIAALPGQTLITVTDPDLLPRLPERRDIEVRAGRLIG